VSTILESCCLVVVVVVDDEILADFAQALVDHRRAVVGKSFQFALVVVVLAEEVVDSDVPDFGFSESLTVVVIAAAVVAAAAFASAAVVTDVAATGVAEVVVVVAAAAVAYVVVSPVFLGVVGE